MTDQAKESGPLKLMGQVLTVRSEQRTAGQVAAIRTGLLPFTEAGARMYTDTFLAGESESSATGWRRAAAICAMTPRTPSAKKDSPTTLGLSLRRLYQAENPGHFSPAPGSAITQQVNALMLLDVDLAAQSLAMLVGRCGAHGIPVNYFDLGWKLARWGRGTTSKSRAVRNRIVTDFYQATANEISKTETSKDNS